MTASFQTLEREIKNLPPESSVLRIWRFNKNDEPVHFTGAIFKKSRKGVLIYLTRANAFGYLLGFDLSNCSFVIDVLDREGDILETFAITEKGFNFFRKKLNAVREN